MRNRTLILHVTEKLYMTLPAALLLAFGLLAGGCRTARPSGDYDPRSTPAAPDYARLENWAAHPQKPDPADRVPRQAGLADAQAEAPVDVFFLHPTIYGRNRDDGTAWNASAGDERLNRATDESTILYQASIFNGAGRVYAPRYRQAHLRSFNADFKTPGDRALDTAYTDVLASFAYFLAHRGGNERPFILAGHSQGARHALRLLRERIEGTPLQNRLVAAYIVGWPVPDTALTKIPPCRTPEQTGCFCSWRTWERDYGRRMADQPGVVCTNPLLWTTEEGRYAPRSLNRGAVVRSFNKIYPGAADAEVYRGFLLCTRPKFPGSFLLRMKNYHIGDFNLYYMNVRENAALRVKRFMNDE